MVHIRHVMHHAGHQARKEAWAWFHLVRLQRGLADVANVRDIIRRNLRMVNGVVVEVELLKVAALDFQLEDGAFILGFFVALRIVCYQEIFAVDAFGDHEVNGHHGGNPGPWVIWVSDSQAAGDILRERAVERELLADVDDVLLPFQGAEEIELHVRKQVMRALRFCAPDPAGVAQAAYIGDCNPRLVLR